LEFLRDEYIKLNFSIQNYQLGDHIFFDSAAIFAQMIASTGKVIPDPEQAEMIRRAAITLALVLNDEVLNAARLVEKLSLRPAYGAVLTSFMEEFLTYTNFDILHDHAYRRAAWEGKTQGVEARPYINDLKSQVLLSADPYLFP
jgi:hypothetical protein